MDRAMSASIGTDAFMFPPKIFMSKIVSQILEFDLSSQMVIDLHHQLVSPYDCRDTMGVELR
jgi:hypothetical protein